MLYFYRYGSLPPTIFTVSENQLHIGISFTKGSALNAGMDLQPRNGRFIPVPLPDAKFKARNRPL